MNYIAHFLQEVGFFGFIKRMFLSFLYFYFYNKNYLLISKYGVLYTCKINKSKGEI